MRRFILIIVLWILPVSLIANQNQISSEERKEYLHRAQVWRPTDVSTMDIVAGPQSEFSVPFNSEVVCSFVVPKKQLTGTTPKFDCKTSAGKIVRVKYGSFECYAEVIATRLLWALGFYVDEVYPVRIKCVDCPEDPFHYNKKSPRFVRVFADAIIKPRFSGITLEEHPHQGWKWSELETVQAKDGGASRAQIDALKLVAVLVQHADSKPDNQQLGCYREDYMNPGRPNAYCIKPVLMIDDLGSTFGSGAGVVHLCKMDFKDWKSTRVFDTREEANRLFDKGQKVCVGNITSNRPAGSNGLNDPVISEAGREFLARLLNQLTERQIHDLFYVARVEYLQEYEDENGTRHKITADDWVQEFFRKRGEINDMRCSGE
jgi:hypothetical protein